MDARASETEMGSRTRREQQMRYGKLLASLVLGTGLAIGAGTMMGCHDDAGDHMDDAGQNLKEGAQDVGQATGEAVENAGDNIKDATN
jgi:hypothetical protein